MSFFSNFRKQGRIWTCPLLLEATGAQLADVRRESRFLGEETIEMETAALRPVEFISSDRRGWWRKGRKGTCKREEAARRGRIQSKGTAGRSVGTPASETERC